MPGDEGAHLERDPLPSLSNTSKSSCSCLSRSSSPSSPPFPPSTLSLAFSFSPPSTLPPSLASSSLSSSSVYFIAGCLAAVAVWGEERMRGGRVDTGAVMTRLVCGYV
eukprot:1117709-Rhodomonas_salina.1